MTDILLIDFSSILHATFHAEASNPNPDATSIKVIARVRALAGQQQAAICCEGKGSFRKALDPTYKANRPAPLAELHHQGDIALEALRGDGFPVWSAAGYEADDVIATAVRECLMCGEPVTIVGQHNAVTVKPPSTTEGLRAVIVSADKDLLQLVGPRVSVHSLSSGKTLDEAAVVEKLGVSPNQVVDYLALVGDKSDNILGAKGVGAVGATKLLNTFGNLDDLYTAIDKGEAAMSAKALESLAEFRTRMPLVRELITLKTDAPIPFEDVFKARVVVDVAVFGEEPMDDISETMQPLKEETTNDRVGIADVGNHEGHLPTPDDGGGGQGERAAISGLSGGIRAGIQQGASNPAQASSAEYQPEAGEPALTPAQHAWLAEQKAKQKEQQRAAAQMLAPIDTLAPVPVEWERQLEPRSLDQAIKLAGHLHASRLFGAYGSPQGVFSTIIAGRELGMDAMASLRAFHIIDNKPTLSAGVIAAMVLKSGRAEYFRCTERTAEKATFVTKRKGDPEMSLTFTIDEAKAAWSKDEKAWKASGWGRNPADMNVARASSKLARLVYPDVVFNLYAPEEFD